MWAGSAWACEHQEVEISEGQCRGWLTTSSLETLDVFVQYTYHLAMVPTPFCASSREERLSQTPFPARFWISFRFSQRVVTWEAEGRGAIHSPAIGAADRSVRGWDFSVSGQALHPSASHWLWAGGSVDFSRAPEAFWLLVGNNSIWNSRSSLCIWPNNLLAAS